MPLGPQRLHELRDSGIDISHSGEAARKRGDQVSEHKLENAKWESRNSDALDDIDFERDILPGLQGFSITKIQRVTGLSLRYCSLIRKGYVPHKRHWLALLKLINSHSMPRLP